jgi:hypothetical protein
MAQSIPALANFVEFHLIWPHVDETHFQHKKWLKTNFLLLYVSEMVIIWLTNGCFNSHHMKILATAQQITIHHPIWILQ